MVLHVRTAQLWQGLPGKTGSQARMHWGSSGISVFKALTSAAWVEGQILAATCDRSPCSQPW